MSCVNFSNFSTFAEAQTVPVDRVRYCRAPRLLPTCNGLTQADYQWWNVYNVAEEKQKRTYIARYSTPAVSNVRHLVFISAGQREVNGTGTLDLEGGNPASFLTGAPVNFVNNFSKGDARRNITPVADSLPLRLLTEKLPPASTFMAAAWDARYNWGFTPENKRDIANAYYSWLKSKFLSSRLRSIYLIGHSRGGALVVELGRRFHQEFPQIPLIVHILDGVPNEGQDELGVAGTVDNPDTNDRNFFAERIDFAALFPNSNNLRIYNQVSGAQVLSNILLDTEIETDPDNIEAVRAFAQAGGEFDAIWLRQEWSDRAHMNFVTGNVPIINALGDFEHWHTVMLDASSTTLPPTAACQVTLVFSGGGVYNQLSITSNGSASNSGHPLKTWNWRFYNGMTNQLLGTASGQTASWTFYKSDPNQTAQFRAELSLTDNFGNIGTTTCSIYL